MIPEIGQFALIVALCLALAQAFFPLVGAARGEAGWIAVARPAAWGQLVFLVVAFWALGYAFVSGDFSVAYVAQNSNSRLPLGYRISAIWGGHEGSVLFWALIMGIWTVAVTLFSRNLPRETAARVIGVMGLVSTGFLLFLLVTSNPFARLYPAPSEGFDLNPLLQDIGLALHPPTLYMGYVGFSVAFSFAIAALLEGRLDAAWARWSRPWTAVAWAFLTVGIAVGSWWAYYELGWGGWWFWDPVENASFMPWLVGTALMHSLAVTENRGAFKTWTVLLAILTFSLSLLGMFLVRSGVLTSVHAFATDPARGVAILIFLSLVVGGSLLLYAKRAAAVRGGGGFQWLSRESALLVNNILLVVTTATILLGTLYPLFLDALGLGKISVGPPYFSSVFIPLMLPVVFLLGLGPLARWKRMPLAELVKITRFAFAVTVTSGLAFLVFMPGKFSWLSALGLAAAVWVTVTTVQLWFRRVTQNRRPWRGLADTPRGFHGMCAAHLGLAALVFGVTLASAYSLEKDVRLAPGESLTLGGYVFRFEGTTDHAGPNYRATRGTIRIFQDNKEITVLSPEKRRYLAQEKPITEAGIKAGLFRDLYVALGEPVKEGAWTMRLYYNPFVRWIWLGTLLMAVGGILAASDRRYRLRIRQKQAATESPARTTPAEEEAR